MEIRCKECKFWQDYNERVHAKIKGVITKHGYNEIELRICQWNAPPALQQSNINKTIYTDQDYYCSEFIKEK